MLFNSFVFIFAFLPITLFTYFLLNKLRLTELSKAFLVFSSLFFYSWWNIIYLPLILSSMLVNFAIGKQLAKNSKKALLVCGIVFNVALLGYFKYMDFFIQNFNFVFNTNIALLHLTLPLAISFFTFQQIAYLVDSYKHQTKEYDLLSYALFVSFFPQLIAGPIVHHKEMMPQFALAKNKIINYTNILSGIFIFTIGLFKKVVIADSFALIATRGFDNEASLDLICAWLTSLSYSFQLYFDFSGYCDMAIGAALLFNIKLPINFNSPYKSLNISDFWRRWHITLGRFLKDYVYIPLGGNKAGFGKYIGGGYRLTRTCINLFITFLIGGLWHGAGWTFIIWGALHGLALVIHRIFTYFNFKLNKILAWFITFNFINFAWIFFRAKNLDDALKVIYGMIGVNGVDYESFKELKLFFKNEAFYNSSNLIFYYIIIAFIIVLFCKNSYEIIQNNNSNILEKFADYIKKISQNKINIIYTLIFWLMFMFCVYLMMINKYTEFIYFNF